MIEVRGEGLTVSDVAKVARGATVKFSDDEAVLARVDASRDYIARAVERGSAIYGVTTCFGGLANRVVPREAAAELQKVAVWMHKATTGERLPAEDVRAAMLLRANSLLRGVSGLRREILWRFEKFLNAGAVPHVFALGSIGASGDLVPLSYIAGSIVGLDPQYRVDFRGEEMDCHTALARMGLEPIALEAKEGLALVNGTSVSTAIAANCVSRARRLVSLAIATHAMFVQALDGTDQSFRSFIHQHKPHRGQVWVASEMRRLLEGSRLLARPGGSGSGRLIQDRYSLRCLPQFIGPIVDSIAYVARQIEVEANSATDNPLIDVPGDAIYHCGNFLAQYVAMGMDQLRYCIGLLAKHMDVQIALVVSPEFNHGLPPSLIGNPDRPFNAGLKSLQLVGNSIMPLLTYYGNSLADRFPTHAEQFNQNINSQATGAANLARRSLDLFEHYMANALLFAVQSVDLRTFVASGHYDARRSLSAGTVRLYETVRRLIDREPDERRPLIWDDTDQFLEPLVATILQDLASGGEILAAIDWEAHGSAFHSV